MPHDTTRNAASFPMTPLDSTEGTMSENDLLIRRSRVRNPPGSLELGHTVSTPVCGKVRGGSEEWRPVVGAPGYRVSSLGRVQGLDGRMLRPSSTGNLYLRVNVTADGRQRTRFVHHLVAEAFLGARPVGYEIDHIDGDRRNAAASNLEYVKRAENVRRAAESRRQRRGACANCARGVAIRRGRCAACAEYMRRTGAERPPRLFSPPQLVTQPVPRSSASLTYWRTT